MGGWNIIADTLLREVPPGADPLGPDNVLVFAPGVLTGLAISGRVAQRRRRPNRRSPAALGPPRWAATGARSSSAPGLTP